MTASSAALSQPASLTLAPDITQSWEQAVSREWLVTNGIGGYAFGTVSGANSRAYHGYLVAATAPPLGRMVLLQHLDETLTVENERYELGCHERRDGLPQPQGFRYMERFWLDGTLPVWEYRAGAVLLEKRVWMPHGENAVCISYRLLEGAAAHIQVLAWENMRDHHTARAHAVDVPYALRGALHGGAAVRSTRQDRQVLLRVEAERGLPASELMSATYAVEARLTPDQPLIMADVYDPSDRRDPSFLFQPDPWQTLRAEQARQQALLAQSGLATAPLAIRQLVLAADQFIVARGGAVAPAATSTGTPTPTPEPAPSQALPTIIAGYPWFGDWGRDTMIALPGLCLATRRYAEARDILLHFARFVSEGMLPNRFPDEGELPEYNTVDATLWYFHALAQYHNYTADDTVIATLYPVLTDIIAWHERGTRYGIGVDPADGLLRAGEPGVQLTWMDVRIDDWVVTPRHGKPVEINALWYNALRLMAGWAEKYEGATAAAHYTALADRVSGSFGRFWYAEGGYLYDVLDTPTGPDATLRPNQVLAIAVAPTLVPEAQRRQALAAVTEFLVTPVGLRTLDPRHPAYQPRFWGDRFARDGAYHQGTVWPWLIGHYLDARAALEPALDRRALLQPLLDHLWDAGLGTISEVFDADPPRHGAGCPAQAWSVAEVLRAWISATTDPKLSTD